MKAPFMAIVRKKLFWVVLLLVGGLGLFAFRPSKKEHAQADFATLITAPVKVGEFVEEISESGEVESSSNQVIRCEVRTRTSGVAILKIVPEGTYVNEGDFLIKLDDSALQEELVTRQITVNGSKAALAQARADLDSAKLTLQEYKSGTFREREEEMLGNEFVAVENLRRAEEYLRYSQNLEEKGYVSQVQLEADRFAVEKAKKELDVARTKLEVLRTYSKTKVLNQLQAAIETATARLSTAERTHAIDQRQFEDTQEQIKKCTINAPTSGQVVYANKIATGNEPLIEEGKMVREMQDLIRLPDPKRMQVTAAVNESRIDRIEENMPVRIKIDALPELELTGTLTKVGEFPLPRTSLYTAYIKNYAAIVTIHEPPESLRPGMTAQVSILVKKEVNATMVPVHAVVERDSRFFCLVRHEQEKRLEAREIAVGGANDQVILVEAGLDELETVVLGPDSYIDDLTLPDPSELAQRKKQKEGLVAKSE